MTGMRNLRKLNLAHNRLEDISWQVRKWWGLKSLDVSNNPNLALSKLVSSLSYFDQINQLKISHVEEFSADFALLNVHDLIVGQTSIEQFPRTANSTQIKRLSFIDCSFQHPDLLVEQLNKQVFPEHLMIEEGNEETLLPFLNVNVDSISVPNNNLKSIAPVVKMENLRYLDVRGNKLNVKEVEHVKKARPDLEIMNVEAVERNSGIREPLPNLKPVKKLRWSWEVPCLIFRKRHLWMRQVNCTQVLLSSSTKSLRTP